MTVEKKRKTVADDVLGQLARKQNDLFGRVRGGVLTPKTTFEVLQDLIEGEFERDVIPKWVRDISRKEVSAHYGFFDRSFSLTKFEKALKRYGRKLVERWQRLGLEPHFLPKTCIIPGWRKEPNDKYCQGIVEGNILRLQPGGHELIPVKEVRLEGIVVLIDTRAKPLYENGKQMFEKDNLLGPIIRKLRQHGKIAAFLKGPSSSRFNISANEWQDVIRPILAKCLNVRSQRVRLETVIEAKIIPQLYPNMFRQKDGETNTSVWYEEYATNAKHRLFGGDSEHGGLSDVQHCMSSDHWDRRAFRPLIVL